MWTYRGRWAVLILEFLEVPFVFLVSCVLFEMRLNLFGLLYYFMHHLMENI